MASIYLDYNASTPIDPHVAGVMRGLLDASFGNPSSSPLGKFLGKKKHKTSLMVVCYGCLAGGSTS